MGSEVEAGFAKLQGEDFEYYMQTYSIILGRNSKKSSVDVDLSSLGGGMNISRHHARIFYDFRLRRFALEVLGKNGCQVEGVLHLPGNPLVKLDSQDLLQIGDKKFYFLLPVRSILGATAPLPPPPPPPPPHHHHHHHHHHHPARPPPATMYGGAKRGRYVEEEEDEEEEEEEDEEEEEEEEDEEEEEGDMGKRIRYGVVGLGKPGSSEKRIDGRPRVDREADNHQLMQLEEKDVVSSVATVLSDLCGPGEFMPMEKLHAELVEQYGNVWHHGRVRRYLSSEDWPLSESKGRPWFGLLTLLRKYPEHFVINTRSKGRVVSEFVSLVSLIS
ncbi:hypothetical protein Sjap_005925 [Stephania japonica]|uniref:FHA domain-containing protein n=1 Tax=Stephania japonica TaxID=461633 RepID=A0AAP0K507_9MAGN